MTTSSTVPLPERPDLPINAYYDTESGRYMIQDIYGAWIKINAADLKLRLRALGYSIKAGKGEHISAVEAIMLRIQQERTVMYAGPLAGHMAGPKHMCGQLVLITHSPHIMPPIGDTWRTIEATLGGLLKDPDYDQLFYFHSWAQHGQMCLRNGIFQPGQAVVFAGPSGCGKSFTQQLVTALFGGRSAKPYRYLTGESTFNRELIGAEHLTIEDEVPKSDIRSRRELGAFIKNTIVNRTQSCHGKFADAVTLQPFWRLTISVNEEPENLQIVPPIDDSMDDKLMLFKCSHFDWPMPMRTPREQEAFWDQIMIELPAYISYLLYEHKVPSELADPRYGVRRFQHPALLDVLNEMTPETRMLGMIDDVIFEDDRPAKWVGTADELKTRLEDSIFRKDVERLLGHHSAVGVNLARLASKRSSRVKRGARTATRKNWEIFSHHFEAGEPESFELKPVKREGSAYEENCIRLN